MNELSDQIKTTSEKFEIFQKFLEILCAQEECPAKYQEIINEKFWELI